MKQINAVKKLLLVALLGVASSASGQVHPKAFGPQTIGATTTASNWYKDYVGLRFEVTAPAVIAGDKVYTYAYSGTAPWGGQVTTPLVNIPIIMDSTADSFGCSNFSINMAGKIAVIWRGPLGGGACEFGAKAAAAQLANAVAVVLINEYPGQGPVGMAAGAVGATVSIPVFMVSNTDGIAISGQYRSGVPVTMTITPWGLGNRNDLGFVPGGVAMWHNSAIPADQLPTGTMPAPYKGLDGAFIANYGTSAGVNVKVAGSLFFTPNGGSQSLVHTDTTAAEANFNAIDSIFAVFAPTEYNFSASGQGKYDLKYTIISDTTDQYPGDNTHTVSFNTTKNVYCKGRYDVAAHQPISTTWQGLGGTAPPDFTWGPMYYVAHGKAAVDSVQFSLYNSGSTLGAITAGPMDILLFKWVDGSNSQPLDSFIENGELSLVARSTYTFGVADTNGMCFKWFFGNPADAIRTVPIYLDTNAWYYVAAAVPGGYYLGCDGVSSFYPRLFGRSYRTNYVENSQREYGADYATMLSNPNDATAPLPFGETAFINSIDSFNYSGMKGLIPSVSMIVNKVPDTSHLHDNVNGTEKGYVDFTIVPNPASDHISVAVSLEEQTSVVYYKIMDGLGRIVARETHHDVKNETTTMSTANLPAGQYYLVVTCDNGKSLLKKFVIVR
jgi:PA domain/Secretion system C-terminal sorting domain